MQHAAIVQLGQKRSSEHCKSAHPAPEKPLEIPWLVHSATTQVSPQGQSRGSWLSQFTVEAAQEACKHHHFSRLQSPGTPPPPPHPGHGTRNRTQDPEPCSRDPASPGTGSDSRLTTTTATKQQQQLQQQQQQLQSRPGPGTGARHQRLICHFAVSCCHGLRDSLAASPNINPLRRLIERASEHARPDFRVRRRGVALIRTPALLRPGHVEQDESPLPLVARTTGTDESVVANAGGLTETSVFLHALKDQFAAESPDL